MPIPKPNAGEEQQSFISRCMANDTMNKEYPDQEQRSAVCYSQWKEGGTKGVRGGDRGGDRDRPLNNDKMQINVKEIKGKEIARTGKYSASTGEVEITEKTLDDFIKNFNDKVTNPFLNLDHDDKLTDKIKKALKVLRLGTVSRLYKIGKSLYADFKDVPEKIADLINSGLMNSRSIEYSKKYKNTDKVYDNVLRAISFFGVAEPAIPGLEDYVEIFQSQEEDDNDKIKITKLNKEVSSMEIEKKEYEELIKSKAEKEIIEIKLKAETDAKIQLQKEVDKLQKEKAEFEVEKTKLQKEHAEYLKQKEEDLKKLAGDYVNDMIGKKKILPKYKDKYINDYIRCSSNEEEFKMFKEDIESRGDAINLGNIKQPNGEDIKLDHDIIGKEPDEITDYMDSYNEKIEQLSKSKKISWEEAKKLIDEEV